MINKSLNLFIIGPSGCGKSTQAKLIASKYSLTHISMGQLLRDEIASASKLGLDAKQTVDQGIPTPDDVVLPILSTKLQKINNSNFIIDGFPRLISQGHYIDRYLKNLGLQTSLLIHLVVDFQEIIKRRLSAGNNFQIEDEGRSDNSPEVIANRQKILYEANVGPVLEYYKKSGYLLEIDGNRPIEPIFADICLVINNLI
jgi:adenylate kinase